MKRNTRRKINLLSRIIYLSMEMECFSSEVKRARYQGTPIAKLAAFDGSVPSMVKHEEKAPSNLIDIINIVEFQMVFYVFFSSAISSFY